MARWAPARADVIGEYADEVLDLFPQGRILVGIDGVDGAGKTTFAHDLAAALEARGVTATAISLDQFLLPGGGPDGSSEAPAPDYDVDAFRRLVLDPYRRGEPVLLQHRNRDGEVADPPTFTPAARSVLVVEGTFVHRRPLAGLWHTTAWLQVPRAIARQRAADRDGIAVDDPRLERESAGVDGYFRELDPRKLANASFDLRKPGSPRRVFADAC
jgi:uridine kinase